jgi:ubiquinone/menaquinone biosynthesis C-methylase UbiE
MRVQLETKERATNHPTSSISSSNVKQRDTVTEQSRNAFDASAPVYDSEYENLVAIKRIRLITSRVIRQYFAPGDALLELNCGTGTDALHFGRQGINVLATDFSPMMIHEAQKKIADQQLEKFVSTQILSFLDLKNLRDRVFDGAYSNLGGLNCTNDLYTVARDLAALIKPGGYFVAIVMSDLALWEMIAFLTRGKWRNALRRRITNGCLADFHGGNVRTYYYSPKNFLTQFSEFFKPVEIMGLNIFTPPPNSIRAYKNLGGLTHMLEKLDDVLAHLYPFYRLGDHFLIVLRRKNTHFT